MIPVAIGFIDTKTKKDVIFNNNEETTQILTCNADMNQFELEFDHDIDPSCLIPSILRNFSAPVRLITPQLRNQELSFLLQHDTDQFNQSEAAANLMTNMVSTKSEKEERSAIAYMEKHLKIFLFLFLLPSFKPVLLSSPRSPLSKTTQTSSFLT